MAEYLPIRAFNRSQQVRIAGTKILPTATTYIDISDVTVRKEFAHHSAYGAVYPVGPLSSVAGESALRSQEVSFTETAGAGTYTGAVVVPAGATIVDIVVTAVALWTASGAVTMKVGDTDDDGFYTAIDLKATDLLAGESISFANAGGKGGAYFVGSLTHVTNRYSASAHTINGIISAAGTAGTAGRTRMTVVYSIPLSVTAATKA